VNGVTIAPFDVDSVVAGMNATAKAGCSVLS